ncbi:MAG: reverse transcriptase/maturase family protein [Patescibacteria group bacterium]
MKWRIEYNEIISIENLLSAWSEFVRGKRKKTDVQYFGAYLFEHILQLHDELVEGTYRHGGYRHFRVADLKPRDIHKASVRDRVLHHAIYRVLYPFFDHTFFADAYSCRIGKGTHRAMDRLRSFAYRVSQNHTRTCWMLKCDIRKFFASVDHGILLKILAKRISDETTFRLLREVIESFSTAPGKGLPLGNLTSQLFCNIYLNELDQFAKHELKARHYLRYGDDFVLLSENRAWLEALIPRIRDFLRSELALELHPQKVSINTFASGVDFLGWVHFCDHRILRRATQRRMVRRIQESPTEATLASYRGLLSHGNARKLEYIFLSE